MKRAPTATGEYYHVFNRGVDKRKVFTSPDEVSRFLQGMEEFNTIKPIGSIFENSFKKERVGVETPSLGNRIPKCEQLVEFVSYCVNPNHYHFILKQLTDDGIKKFMHRMGVGYTNYFNNKNKRSGSLFQGKYKIIHIDTNEYLLHLSAYANLNDKVHQLGNWIPKSSWEEYVGAGSNEDAFGSGFCGEGKRVILEQFTSPEEYKKFAESSLEDILQRREEDKEFEKLLID